MDIFLSDHITTLAVGLILSIAIFGAFKAGQVFERATISGLSWPAIYDKSF